MATRAVCLPRPVFVTSTLRDTHAERDWLRTRVFPELEERLRARRCHLEPIDLRWGVETADARGFRERLAHEAHAKNKLFACIKRLDHLAALNDVNCQHSGGATTNGGTNRIANEAFPPLKDGRSIWLYLTFSERLLRVGLGKLSVLKI